MAISVLTLQTDASNLNLQTHRPMNTMFSIVVMHLFKKAYEGGKIKKFSFELMRKITFWTHDL